MSTLSIVLISFGTLVLLASIGVLIFRAIAVRNVDIRPCYRCGDIATGEYMGLRYCIVCRIVIINVFPTVRHDPPFGFPGAAGYLDWPKELTEELKKKEEGKSHE